MQQYSRYVYEFEEGNKIYIGKGESKRLSQRTARPGFKIIYDARQGHLSTTVLEYAYIFLLGDNCSNFKKLGINYCLAG
jgi:hypothetical protein